MPLLPASLKSCDRALYSEAKSILVLKHFDWPVSVQHGFLKAWREKRPVLPKVTYVRPDFVERKASLLSVLQHCDREHPIGHFLAQTAESYLRAMLMVENAGTPTFTELSRELYGAPKDGIGWGGLSHLAAADQFIAATQGSLDHFGLGERPYCLTPRYVAARLRHELRTYFRDHKVRVVVARKLASKASAGAKTIRVRARTPFTELDLRQLTNHEAFVHTLTKINGQEQKRLRCLGLSSPRTMQTQEGLATFAELITGSIDLQRLLRIALRTRAVQMALDGADFLEVFRFFLESGQIEIEAFNSARRIFRGGDPRGRIVFTKDVVYLQGLVQVHTFFRKAFQRGRFSLTERLFAGRMTLADAIALHPFFESGVLRAPYYIPPWLREPERLAAHLCFSVFANQIDLHSVRFGDFLDDSHLPERLAI